MSDTNVVSFSSKSDEKKVKKLYQVMNAQLRSIDYFPEEYAGITNILSWLKCLMDPKTQMIVPPGSTPLDVKKLCHDNYLTIAHTMTTRCKTKQAELLPIVEAIAFANEMVKTIKEEIDLIEPPKEKEAAKPYEMDLTHVKAEEKPANVQTV